MLEFLFWILDFLAIVWQPVRLGKLVHRAVFGSKHLHKHTDFYYGMIGFTAIATALVLLAVLLLWKV